MKAAVLFAIESPLRICDVEPCELQAGQVLVNVTTAGICGAQIAEIDGKKGNAKFLPHLMGHEGVGRVEQIGPGVRNVRRGQRVVMHWRPGAGIESEFPQYDLKQPRKSVKRISSGRVITFAEQAICSENRLTPIDDAVPDELCALLGCSLSTAFGIMEREAELMVGERVLVIGCGGLGINLIRAARARGAGRIDVIDRWPTKRTLAYEMGASYFFDTQRPWLGAAVMREMQYDVILDTAGSVPTASECIMLLASGGRYIMIGQPSPDVAFMIPNAVEMFAGAGKIVRATQGGGFIPHRDIPRYVAAFRAGTIKLDGIVSETVTLDKVNDAILMVREGDAGRIMIKIS